jgi:hypothetical protein
MQAEETVLWFTLIKLQKKLAVYLSVQCLVKCSCKRQKRRQLENTLGNEKESHINTTISHFFSQKR